MRRRRCCSGSMLVLLINVDGFAQQRPNWQNLGLQKDSVFGISTDKGYAEILKGKVSKPVVVAVIDAGVDTLHEYLKNVLWINPKKRAGDNGTYGWSYLGSAKGNVHYDNLELTRQIRSFGSKDTTKLGASDLQSYHAEKKELQTRLTEARQNIDGYTNFLNNVNALAQKTGKENPDVTDFKAVEQQTPSASRFIDFVCDFMTKRSIDYAGYRKILQGGIDHFKEQVDYQLNTSYDPRMLVGDHYENVKESQYGSRDVMGPCHCICG